LPRISGIGRHDLADMCLDGFPHFAKALRGPARKQCHRAFSHFVFQFLAMAVILQASDGRPLTIDSGQHTVSAD